MSFVSHGKLVATSIERFRQQLTQVQFCRKSAYNFVLMFYHYFIFPCQCRFLSYKCTLCQLQWSEWSDLFIRMQKCDLKINYCSKLHIRCVKSFCLFGVGDVCLLLRIPSLCIPISKSTLSSLVRYSLFCLLVWKFFRFP